MWRQPCATFSALRVAHAGPNVAHAKTDSVAHGHAWLTLRAGIRPRRVAVVAHASQHFYPTLHLTFKKVKRGGRERGEKNRNPCATTATAEKTDMEGLQ